MLGSRRLGDEIRGKRRLDHVHRRICAVAREIDPGVDLIRGHYLQLRSHRRAVRRLKLLLTLPPSFIQS
jgi:hypothetical protein